MRRTLLFPILSVSLLASVASCGSPPAPARPIAKPVAPCDAADAGANAIAAPREPSLEEIKDELVKRINAGDTAGIYGMFSSSMKGTFPPPVLSQLVEGVRSSKGTITATHRTHDDGDMRSATYAAKAERGDWRVELHIDDAGQIIGLALQEPPPPESPVADSKLPLALPVRGKWLVAWAGDTPEHNPHILNKEQRRAADLVVVEGGKHFKTDGKKNEDYFAYGKDVFAMADGTVKTVIDGVPENTPGTVNTFYSPGNLVIVEHSGPVYSVYAHLQPGKMRVKPGSKIKQGAPVGVCGNSGNASEPHLHVQLQDAGALEAAWGVNPVFTSAMVTRGGQTTKMESYSFKKDDVIDVTVK